MDHAFAIHLADGHGLFYQDMLPGLHRLYRDICMGRIGRADRDDIDGRIVYDRFERVIVLEVFILVAKQVEAVCLDIIDALKPCFRMSHDVLGVAFADFAVSD